ncbi:hypothetical protein FQ775_15865 [Nitratireductor mangrovi]|uniref:Uncharacterized protein n=1 Tax=Nitratireductor mangrovi TaxID=2599600 RepID=A0A5B8L2I0_9HYPH|nr:hypothetical protein [Nitratireductor mangrovi]QDZ01728.1 hypothetical protein FQ775_15865 [Nitratireductor mangrovi]
MSPRIPMILSATAMTLFAAEVAMADDAAILASCKTDLQLSDSGCACVLDKVHSTLNDKQLAFFVAAIKKDTATQQKAQMALSGEEMMEMANFMTMTPQQCQNQ